MKVLRRRYGRARLTEEQKGIASREIRAAAQQALRDGSNWQANALWALRKHGFPTSLSQEIVKAYEQW